MRFTRALRNRNFAIYVAGNAFNLIGLWMQRISIGWLTWALTESGAWLGIIAFADLCPALLIGPLAGAIADQKDRLALARITQALAMLVAALLAFMTLSDQLTIGWLLGLTLLHGIVLSFWQPVRLTLISNLAPGPDLASAVAINSVVFNIARFIGPAVAGIMIVMVGAGWAFAANAATLAIFLAALYYIQVPQIKSLSGGRGDYLSAILAGYRYAIRHPGIGPCLLLMLVSCLCLRPVFELLPGFAADVFQRGAEGLSALASVTGVGAVIGGFWLGQRASLTGLVKLAVNHFLVLVICLLAFVSTEHFWLGLISLGVAGSAVTLSGAGIQTLIQSAVDENMRGRVMSLYGMIIRGGPAIGALLMGFASEVVGLRLPLAVGGVLMLLVWLWARGKIAALTESLESSL